MSLFTGGGAADLGISKPSLPSFTAPLIGLLDTTSRGGAFTVFGGVSSLSSLRSSSAGREESQDRSLFSLVGERHSSGGKVTCGEEMSCNRITKKRAFGRGGYFTFFGEKNENNVSLPGVQSLGHPQAGLQCQSVAQQESAGAARPTSLP